MKLVDIVSKYSDQISRTRFLVVSSPCEETGEDVYSIVYQTKRGNFAQDIQSTHVPIVFPEQVNYKFVALELHHPQNNVFLKYGIEPKEKFKDSQDWGWGRNSQ